MHRLIQVVIESGTALEKRVENQPRRYTYDELLAKMPQNNLPCELWDGEVIMSPAPSYSHQKIVLRFYRQLDDWVSEHRPGEVVTGPIDMVLSPHRVAQPDVVFISKGRYQVSARGTPGEIAASQLLPGFTVSVSALFARD